MPPKRKADHNDETPPPPARVAGYIRLSRESDTTSSPAKQWEIIESFVAAKRIAHPGAWELVDVVSDINVSATKQDLDDRPGLARIRQMVHDREIDAVIVWRLDRLARSVIDYGTLLREGLAVASCTESLDATTIMGRAMVKILLVFAEMESETIGERLRSTIAYRVGQGNRWRGGAVPHGYRSVPYETTDEATGKTKVDGKTLVVDPTEAAFIRQAAEMVLSGATLYSAMQTIDAAGSRPRRGDRWALSSLRVVLTGDSVLGRQTRHGEVMRGDDGVILTPWEPILRVDDVERLRAILKPRPLAQARRKASRLLSGLLVCHTCGRRMRVNSRRDSGGSRIESYGCRTNVDGAKCTRPASINADQIEEYVAADFLAVAGALPVVERVEVIHDDADLVALDEAIAHTTDAMRKPGANRAELFARVDSLHVTREELAARPLVPTVEERETGETYAERWADSKGPERRILLEGMLRGSITVKPIGRGYRRIDADRVGIPWPWTLADRPDVDLAEGASRGPGDPAKRRKPASASLSS